MCLVAAAALTSCNRAEYAMLPKTSSAYHGTQYTVTAPKPAAPAAEIAVAPVAPAATPETAPVLAETPTAAPAATPAPVAVAPQQAKKGPKLNLIQKMMANKVVKKADKLANKILPKEHRDSAEVNRISGNLRTGVILLIVGLLISLIPGDIFDLVGAILAIIGIIFLVLWLLDEL